MVFGVCRRMLNNRHDAEDAFQAVFLVLATRARSIGKRASVGSWLYKIALRVALRSRARAVRNACAAIHGVPIAAPDQPDALIWQDIRRVLDEEVGRLPERYRSVFVLCHLEGKSNAEAARECGVPVGTVVSRLARARERLRVRLTRRGLTLSAGLMAAGLSQETAAAPLPALVIASTMKAILWGAAEPAVAAGVLTAQAAALTKGVLHAMWLTKIKLTAATVLSVALIGSAGTLTYRTVAAGQGDSQAGASQPTKPESSAKGKAPQGKSDRETDLVELRRRRFNLRMKRAELQNHIEKIHADLQILMAEEAANQKQIDMWIEESDLPAEKPSAPKSPLVPKTTKKAPLPELNNGPSAEGGWPVPKTTEKPPLTTFTPRPGPIPDQTTDELDAAKDGVELLQAQLTQKGAALKAAQAAWDFTKMQHARYRELVKSRSIDDRLMDEMTEKLNKATAEYDAAAASFKITEVSLKQAQRRLARLQEHARSSPNPAPVNPVQQLRQLETQLEALRQQTEQLRRQMEKPQPQKPAT